MRLMRMAIESQDKAVEQQAAAPTDETKEAAEAKGPTIVMKGPLAEIYRKALDVALAKKDSVTGEATVGQEEGIATESQANDALVAAHLAQLVGDETAENSEQGHRPDPAVMTVYGVSSKGINDQVIVEVTSYLAQKPAERDFFLVVDATQPGPNSEDNSAPEERLLLLGQALESMVQAHGGHTFHTLKELRDHMMQTHQHTTWAKEISHGVVAAALAPAAAVVAALG